MEHLKPGWRDANKYAMNLYSCELKSWDTKSTCPFGKLVKVNEEMGLFFVVVIFLDRIMVKEERWKWKRPS